MIEPKHRQEGSKPDPDPTVLTTEQMHLYVNALRDLVQAKLEGIHERMVRLDNEVIHLIATRAESIDTKVNALRDLQNEKFSSVQAQLAERELRTKDVAALVKTAVDAALSAAEKAVAEQNKSGAAAIAKSEAYFSKQIDSQGAQINTAVGSIDSKITDLKERLNKSEGRDTGKSAAWELVVAVIGILFGVVGVAVAIFRGHP